MLPLSLVLSLIAALLAACEGQTCPTGYALARGGRCLPAEASDAGPPSDDGAPGDGAPGDGAPDDGAPPGDACGVETCNGLDDDCDGIADEGVTQTYYVDSDRDGYGVAAGAVQACSAPAGRAPRDGDCDDRDAAVHPGAAEVCDGADDDCDGVADQTFACVVGDTVSCAASCGTTGTGACTASCETPAGRACTPPAELCNGADDDCDGAIDEAVQTVGPALDLTGATGTVAALRTRSGFVVVYGTASGIRGQRLDAAGAPIGASLLLTATAPSAFSAAVVGSQIVLSYAVVTFLGTALVGVVLPDDLISAPAVQSAVHSSTVAGVVFSPRTAVAQTSTGPAFFFHDGTHVLGLRCSDSLSGCTTPRVLEIGRPDFDVALAARGDRAYLAMIDGSDHLVVRAVTLSTMAVSGWASLASTAAQRRPAIAVGVAPSGQERIGVAWSDDRSTASSDGYRLGLVEVAAAGDLVTGAQVGLASGGLPIVSRPVALAFTGGRWLAAALVASSASTSRWLQIEAGADPTSTGSMPITSVEADAAFTSLAIAPGDAGEALLAGATSSGARAHVLGCR